MKLRCQPEDFCVTEVTRRFDNGGPYRLFQLKKRSLGTLEAIERIRRHWNLDRRQISHGGLKDRHAVTSQFITIRNGPDVDFTDDLIDVSCCGSTDRPFDAQDIAANEFRIVVRSLSADAAKAALDCAADVSQYGILNYFDRQRFGSLGVSGDFVARHWCLRDYEKALWLALAERNVHDSPVEREQKEILRHEWGKWNACKEQLTRSNRRSVVTYLVDHPDKFKKAFALINTDLRGLFLSAFQSAVWNRMLAVAISDRADTNDGTPGPQITIADAELPLSALQIVLPESQQSLPLPSIRCRNAGADIQRLIEKALSPYEMTRRQMKVHFPRDRWFSRALRPTIVCPEGLTIKTGDDERYPRKHKVTLEFQLPRGCYATMLLKFLRLDDELESAIDEAEGGDPFGDSEDV